MTFFFILLIKVGKTDPLDPITFPYLTTENETLLPEYVFAETKSLSEHNLVAPYKLTGETALSVLKAITFLTLL